MERDSEHRPPGWPAVLPRIVVHDAAGCAHFVREAFGARGAWRAEAPTELELDGSLLLVSEAGERDVATAFLYVYVTDADAAYRRALELGAVSLEPPAEMPYGDRRAMVRDRWGNVWQIATHRASAPAGAERAPAIVALEHVQLAMPPGGEDRARAFYGELLGIPETPKPPALAARGGVWFERGALKIHLGVEPGFRPARKAHPGLLVQGLPALLARLRAAGAAVREDPLEDRPRAYVEDPFGNRLELVEAVERGGGRAS